MSHLRIYLASSWKNAQAVRIILDCLRRDGLEVDCFCDQEGGRVGFNIRDCLEKLGGDINGIDAITAFEHPAVSAQFKIAFAEDKKWLDWSNCAVMLMPCGRSAHLEAGYAKGQGKLLYIYWLNELVKGFCSVCVARVSEASYPPRRIITSRRFFIEDREGGKNYGRND